MMKFKVEARPTNKEGEIKPKPEAFKDIAEQIADGLEKKQGYDGEEIKMIAEELVTIGIKRKVNQ